MDRSPETRQSLLLRIRDSDDSDAWDTFAAIYAPMIHGYAMRRGMQDADAADVTQQVLNSIVRAIPEFKYDPQQGTFRGWLFTITRNHLYKSFDKQRRIPKATGDTAFHQSLDQTADHREEEAAWNRDHEIQLFRWAAERAKSEFKEATWWAFWRTAVDHEPPGAVAESLKLSVGAVYIAKSRVLARIREMIQFAERDMA